MIEQATRQQSDVAALGRIWAVLVTYNSGPEVFRAFESALAQVEMLVIVDNGSAPALVADLESFVAAQGGRARLIANSGNTGLAAAQNQGIAAALGEDADWVLLLDDDSLPRPDMIEALAGALAGTADAARVGLLAPAIRQPDAAGETRYWTMRGRWRVVRRRLGTAVEPDALFVIASGSLLRAAALRSLDGMREDFFIDYVDVEFGLRLRAAGWRILVVPSAVLEHRLGAPTRHGLGALRVKATNHDPARRFTIFRNRARLWRAYFAARPGWVACDIAAACADVARILFFERQKAAKLVKAAAGLWRGLTSPRLSPHRFKL